MIQRKSRLAGLLNFAGHAISSLLTRKLALTSLLALACLVTLPGCSHDDRPSLLLIIMDTTRHDRLGCAGYERATTPHLDSLATTGVRFANTIAAAPVTGPAITSILSSVVPATHGVRDNRRFVLNRNLGLLAEAFRAADYQTGAVVGAVPLLARFGYARGFASYDDRFAEDPYLTHTPAFAGRAADLRQSERRASAVTDRALRWLRGADRGRPVFLLAHYFDPHGPYDPPPEYAALHPADPYDGEIAYMDAEIGRLLAGAREIVGADRLRVVAVGDHGEGLFDHNEMAHGFFVYDTTVKVPLLFSGEGVAAGSLRREAVRTIDIAPTICGWLGVEPPATFTGQDLTASLGGGPVPAACDTAYVETFWTQLHYSWSPLQSVRVPDWKWIKAPRPELYALADDPGEGDNLAVSAHAESAPAGSPLPAQTSLAAWLESFLAEAETAAGRLGATLADADPELDRKLEALGYVSGRRHDEVTPNYDLPDPKDGNRNWNPTERRLQHLNAAQRLYEHGRLEDALRRLSLADEIEPLATRDAALQGLVLRRLGRLQEALISYRTALRTEEDPEGRGFILMEIIQLLRATGHEDEAAAQIDSLRRAPHTPEMIRSFLSRLDEENTQQN